MVASTCVSQTTAAASATSPSSSSSSGHYRCDSCGSEFQLDYQLWWHWRDHIPIRNRLLCHLCPFVSTNRESLKQVCVFLQFFFFFCQMILMNVISSAPKKMSSDLGRRRGLQCVSWSLHCQRQSRFVQACFPKPYVRQKIPFETKCIQYQVTSGGKFCASTRQNNATFYHILKESIKISLSVHFYIIIHSKKYNHFILLRSFLVKTSLDATLLMQQYWTAAGNACIRRPADQSYIWLYSDHF